MSRAPKKRPATRRTENVRVRGRAADVIARVMDATAHELIRVSYAALRVEDVAARSGVNKTTIYRRWPTKPQLVAEAIKQQVAASFRAGDLFADTGSLRGDLRATLVYTSQLSPAQLAILRVVQTERTEPEIEAITLRMRDGIRRMRIAIVERAVARGELPQGVDGELLVDLVSAITQRALLLNERLKPSYIDRVLDLVIAGALATNKKRGASKRGAVARGKRRSA